MLRKDFILDPYQVVETRALGADCILLIMAALEDREAQELAALAAELGHGRAGRGARCRGARSCASARIALIGVNNRNLKTLRSILQYDREARAAVPGRSPAGRRERARQRTADLERMAAVGARCFLVGEALMRQADVRAATAASARPRGRGVSELSHFDAAGNAVMVDVAAKPATERVAVASARVLMRRRRSR